MLPALALLFAAASCSDDVPVKEKETPVLTEAFRVDLEGKIWQEANPEQTMYITNDGKLVTPSELPETCGATYTYAYYFADGKATVFQRQTSGPASSLPPTFRYTFAYTVDFQSGTISFVKADGSHAGGNLPFEIEKLTDSELVIHDKYYVQEGYKYRRCVLTPVPKAEEQQWWDTFTDKGSK